MPKNPAEAGLQGTNMLEEKVWALFKQIENSTDEEQQLALRERLLGLANRSSEPSQDDN